MNTNMLIQTQTQIYMKTDKLGRTQTQIRDTFQKYLFMIHMKKFDWNGISSCVISARPYESCKNI